MQLAREQGDEIRGLESAEQQMEWISAGTDEEQLAALKQLLALSDEEFDGMMTGMDEGVRAWMKGDTKPLEAYIEAWREGDGGAASAGMSYETMIALRNENWAGQLQELLKGEGIAFVAVGGGHVVGADSVQSKLAERGIRVSKH
jgi:uncharacterized protein YbaP (TraB family)